jgi:hypothetical protein
MPARKKPIHGVGINDSKESTAEGSRLRPYYNKWRDMLDRCYSGKHSAYEEASVCGEWLNFSSFYEWMNAQPWIGNEIDKDILVPGNTLYSPSTCVFVPRIVNLQFRRTKRSSSGLPAGVYPYPYDGNKTKYKVNGIKCHLGYVTDPMKGHALWQAEKISYLRSLVGLSKDERVNSRISELADKIAIDLSNGLETDWS